MEKVTKINARITSKPHAHLQTMEKTCTKFQKDRYKMLTRSQGTHIEVEKLLSSQSGKSDKKLSNSYIQTTCTSSYHDENTSKVSKRLGQNCKRSCAHKTPRVNVDGRTGRRTNGQTDEQMDKDQIWSAMIRQDPLDPFWPVSPY